MRRSPTSVRISYNHAGLTHFRGGPLSPAEPRLQRFANAFGVGLSHYLGIRSHRDRLTPTFKRNLSVPDGVAELSRPTDFATIFVERPSLSPGTITPCQ